jgi:hypothetical protein
MWAVFIAGNHDREHVFPLIRGLQDLVGGEGRPRVVFTERPALVPVTARSGEQARLPDGQVQLMLLPYPTPTRYDLADQRWPSPDAKRHALAEALRERIGELAREASLPAGQAGSAPGVPVVLCGHFLVRGVREGFYR